VRTLSEASKGLVIFRVLVAGILATADSDLSRFWPTEATLPPMKVGNFSGLQLDSELQTRNVKAELNSEDTYSFIVDMVCLLGSLHNIKYPLLQNTVLGIMFPKVAEYFMQCAHRRSSLIYCDDSISSGSCLPSKDPFQLLA